MTSRRVGGAVTGAAYLALIACTWWFGTLDTLAQAHAVYPASGLVLLTATLAVTYAVKRYQRLDELAQRIHLTALAVGFVGFFVVLFALVLVQFSRIVDPARLWFFLAGPNQPMTLGLQAIALMSVLYLIGWAWGRARYR